MLKCSRCGYDVLWVFVFAQSTVGVLGLMPAGNVLKETGIERPDGV